MPSTGYGMNGADNGQNQQALPGEHIHYTHGNVRLKIKTAIYTQIGRGGIFVTNRRVVFVNTVKASQFRNFVFQLNRFLRTAKTQDWFGRRNKLKGFLELEDGVPERAIFSLTFDPPSALVPFLMCLTKILKHAQVASVPPSYTEESNLNELADPPEYEFTLNNNNNNNNNNNHYLHQGSAAQALALQQRAAIQSENARVAALQHIPREKETYYGDRSTTNSDANSIEAVSSSHTQASYKPPTYEDFHRMTEEAQNEQAEASMENDRSLAPSEGHNTNESSDSLGRGRGYESQQILADTPVLTKQHSVQDDKPRGAEADSLSTRVDGAYVEEDLNCIRSSEAMIDFALSSSSVREHDHVARHSAQCLSSESGEYPVFFKKQPRNGAVPTSEDNIHMTDKDPRRKSYQYVARGTSIGSSGTNKTSAGRNTQRTASPLVKHSGMVEHLAAVVSDGLVDYRPGNDKISCTRTRSGGRPNSIEANRGVHRKTSSPMVLLSSAARSASKLQEGISGDLDTGRGGRSGGERGARGGLGTANASATSTGDCSIRRISHGGYAARPHPLSRGHSLKRMDDGLSDASSSCIGGGVEGKRSTERFPGSEIRIDTTTHVCASDGEGHSPYRSRPSSVSKSKDEIDMRKCRSTTTSPRILSPFVSLRLHSHSLHTLKRTVSAGSSGETSRKAAGQEMRGLDFSYNTSAEYWTVDREALGSTGSLSNVDFSGTMASGLTEKIAKEQKRVVVRCVSATVQPPMRRTSSDRLTRKKKADIRDDQASRYTGKGAEGVGDSIAGPKKENKVQVMVRTSPRTVPHLYA